MIMDREEKRIAKALGAQEVPEVDEGNLLKYRKYLLGRLDKGTVLTGREDFPWEEGYVIASGNLAEYERLKKENPSYKDDYKLIDISEEEIEENDLVAQVERLSDKKCFKIGLSWLTTKNKKSKDFQVLDDFATWVVNWC
jgi:hypothetical protein